MVNTHFVDYIKVYCKSGDGGSGSVSLHREKFIDKGGPDGGDGGRGGHIILQGDSNLWTLLHLKYKRHIRAMNGKPGGKNRLTGRDGEDVILKVPVGTLAKDEQGNFLLEITKPGEQKILIEGGKGGRGNWHFKSPTRQTPRYAQPGINGTEGQYILELKVLADVGLVGLPNAGKSTLLSVVSAAKPKVASYAFTTLTPNLGIVKYHDFQSFVMADIPGIIAGASEGKGLGHRFLRHIERNSTLLFLIPADAENHFDEYKVLLNELEKYNPELLDKKRLVSISKSDLLDDELKAEISALFPKEIPLCYFSSITQEGIEELKNLLWEQLSR